MFLDESPVEFLESAVNFTYVQFAYLEGIDNRQLGDLRRQGHDSCSSPLAQRYAKNKVVYIVSGAIIFL
jgi:hypothetical protein